MPLAWHLTFSVVPRKPGWFLKPELFCAKEEWVLSLTSFDVLSEFYATVLHSPGFDFS